MFIFLLQIFLYLNCRYLFLKMHVADIDFIFLGHLETSVFQAPKVSLVVSQGYLKHILFYYSNKINCIMHLQTT